MRDGTLAGRTFYHPKEMEDAFFEWLPGRRAQMHRTHGEVIAVRAEADRAALSPLPSYPYLVAERHLRSVGKDCLISFESSLYSVPWRRVRRHMKVKLRVTPEKVCIFTVGPEPEFLAGHERARVRGSWVIDPLHWEGLPTGAAPGSALADADFLRPLPEPEWLASPSLAASVSVARRDLATYDKIGVLA